MKMATGHKDCAHDVDVTEIGTVGGVVRRDEMLTCHHDHREKLYASDDMGLEYPVGRYCACCDSLFERF